LGLNEPMFGEPRDIQALQGADMYSWRKNRTFQRPSEPIPARHRMLVRGLPRAEGHMDRRLIESMAEHMEKSFEAALDAIRRGDDPIEAIDRLFADEPDWPRGPLAFPPE